jgi:hypothetical protein
MHRVLRSWRGSGERHDICCQAAVAVAGRVVSICRHCSCEPPVSLGCRFFSMLLPPLGEVIDGKRFNLQVGQQCKIAPRIFQGGAFSERARQSFWAASLFCSSTCSESAFAELACFATKSTVAL